MVRSLIGIYLVSACIMPDAAHADFLVGKEHYHRGAFADAAAQFRRGMQQGDARAIYSLGVLYHHGHGVGQNHIMALDLWKHAARHGLVEAAIKLASVYEMGQMTRRDLVLAYMWYGLAELGGSTFSARQRNRIAGRLSNEEMNRANALKEEWALQIVQKNGANDNWRLPQSAD